MRTDDYVKKCEQAKCYHEICPLFAEIETLSPVHEYKQNHYSKSQTLKNLAWYYAAWYHLSMENHGLREEIDRLQEQLDSEKEANAFLTAEAMKHSDI